MKEEWDLKVLQLEKSVRAFLKTPEGEKLIFTPGMRLKHSGADQLLYTIVAVDRGRDEVVIRPADEVTSAHDFSITSDDLEGDDPEYVRD